MKKKFVGIIISVIMLVIPALVVGVAPIDSNDTYSYIIYKNGNNICVKSGTTGIIEKNSTSATDVFNYAITHLSSNGGTIFVKAGSYTIISTLPIVQGLVIIGEGVTSTMLEMSSTANCPMFGYTGLTDIYFFTMEHLQIMCQSGSTVGSCVKTNTHVNDGLIFDVYITHFKESGLDLGTTWGWRIDQSVFEYMGGDGLHLHGGLDAYITNVKSILNEGNGINLDSAYGVTMIGNYIGKNRKNGVLFNNTQSCTLVGNVIYGNDKYKTGLYSDVYFTGSTKYNTICANRLEGSQVSTYNMYLGSSSSLSRNIITSNAMSGAVSGTVRRTSSNTDTVKINVGYTTENYGTCTITNSNVVTVNHGLSTTPKAISITPIGQFVSFYVDSITSTQFKLLIDRTTTVSFYWTAFA